LLRSYVALLGLSVNLAVAQNVSEGTPESGSTLQEIVVTATRRAENLSQVPQSIAAFDASALESQGIRTAQDLAALAPGVDFSQTVGLQTNISIRGISNTAGTGGQSATGASTTGIYLDDTPVMVRSLGNGNGDPLSDIFDLDHVEVLRGPQGTLFGSGSEGGAIRFISVQPSLSDSSGFVRAELGFTRAGDTSYDVGAAAGAPLIDGTLGFRISAHDRHDGGFIDRTPYPDGAGPDSAQSDSNYSDTKSVRAALLWSPTEDLQITPALYFRQTYINDVTTDWVALSNPATQRYVDGNGQNSPDTNTSSLASVVLNWTLGPVELISNTSYYNRDETNFSDFRAIVTNTFLAGANPYPVFTTPGYYDNGVIDNTQNNWTQELRVQSTRPIAHLSWVAGLFYQNARQTNYENNRTPYFNLESGQPELTADDASAALFQTSDGVGIPLYLGQYLLDEKIVTRDKQLAGFGEVNFDLTSHLRLTGGLRVARTEIDYFDAYNGPLAGGGPGEDSGKHVETPKTPKYSVSYRFDSDNMLYATVADGFRVGGVNPQIQSSLCGPELAALGFATEPRTYNSDRVRSYELGAKMQPFERLRVALSAYYVRWSNIIQPVDLVNCGQLFTSNLGKAVSKGADMDLTFAPTRNLMLNLLLNYDDARFTETIRQPGATSDIVSAAWTLGQTPWTVVASGEYKFNGPFGWGAYARTDVTYRSSNNGLTSNTDPESATYNPLLRPNPSTQDVRLRLGAVISNWDVSLFVNNATNNHPLLDLQNDALGGAIAHALPVRPITVGITVLSKFTPKNR
jgi:outer membrane receptor protein involved in Fe transport